MGLIIKSLEWFIPKSKIKDEAPGELVIYPIPGYRNRPEWFEVYGVEDRDTLVFLGFVGRLGMSNTWEWDDGYHSKGKGRAKS